jgi:hypothetical protein
MNDERRLTPNREQGGWLRRSTSWVVDLVSDLFASNSMMCILVTVVGSLVAYCGYIFWMRQHSFAISAGFLVLVMVLAAVYAAFYAWNAGHTKEFRRGLVSARFVLCVLSLLAMCSFLYIGDQMQLDTAYSSWDQDLALIAGPAVDVYFACMYGLYANCVSRDRRYNPNCTSVESIRWGAGRLTLSTMTIVVFSSFLYTAWRAVAAMDGGNALFYIFALLVAATSCMLSTAVFKLVVPIENDRGLVLPAPAPSPPAG